MAAKVNYAFQKAERDRAKQAKKAAKARDKAAAANQTADTDSPANGPDDAAAKEENG